MKHLRIRIKNESTNQKNFAFSAPDASGLRAKRISRRVRKERRDMNVGVGRDRSPTVYSIGLSLDVL